MMPRHIRTLTSAVLAAAMVCSLFGCKNKEDHSTAESAVASSAGEGVSGECTSQFSDSETDVLQGDVMKETKKEQETSVSSSDQRGWGDVDFIWPVPGYTYILKKYMSNGSKSISVRAVYDANVVAPADGVVVKISKNASEDFVITIKHENGFVSEYSGVDPSIKNGDAVKRGDKIGAVKNSDIPHLTITLYKDGAAIDPIVYMLGQVRSALNSAGK